MNEYEIIEFKNGNIELSVNVSPKEDTVWLTKEQIDGFLLLHFCCRQFCIIISRKIFHN